MRDRLERAVEADAVAVTAAQEVAHGGFEDAPAEIPQGDLDAAGGGDGDAADGARAGALHQHFGEQLVDVEGVLAHHDGLHFIKDHVLDAPAPIGFADAVESGIGFDLDEIPVPRAPHDHDFDVGDFDFLSLGRSQMLERAGKQDTGGGGTQKIAAVHSALTIANGPGRRSPRQFNQTAPSRYGRRSESRSEPRPSG